MQVVRPAALAVLALMAWWRPAAPAEPTVEPQPRAADAIRPYLTPTEPVPAGDHLLAALRERVSYVFVLFQENRSFDSYFGSFPGAHGLYSQSPEDTPGYTQPLIDTDGTTTAIRPFRLGPEQHAADLGDVDHSHARMAAKMHVVGGVPRMD